MKEGFFQALESHPNYTIPCDSESAAMEQMKNLVEKYKEESNYFLIYWYPFESHSYGCQVPPGYQFQGFGGDLKGAMEAKKSMEGINYSPAYVVKLPNGKQPWSDEDGYEGERIS
jgi:hypothetical protein